MIEKAISMPLPPLGRTATTALVKSVADGVYVYDLRDEAGTIMLNACALPDAAPFALTQEEVEAIILVGA